MRFFKVLYDSTIIEPDVSGDEPQKVFWLGTKIIGLVDGQELKSGSSSLEEASLEEVYQYFVDRQGKISGADVEIYNWVNFQINFASMISSECGRRIFFEVSQNTQMNLTAAMADGELTNGEAETFRKGRLWIKAMQAAARDMIAAKDADYMLDSKWPTLDQDVKDLVALY